MKERPILFSAQMVRAILDGRKTQTRRIVNKPIPVGHKFHGWIIESTDKKRDGCAAWSIGDDALAYDLIVAKCPYGKPGDRLWVRETFLQDTEGFIYRADGDFEGNAKILGGWRPSIHMPRSASRILLEITGVRVERLQDISECDAKAEGSYVCDYFGRRLLDQSSNQGCYKWGYRSIWESLNGSGSWHLNPFVWVVEFRTLEIARAAA